MNIVLLTQNDPFYLGRSIAYLLERLPDHSRVVGCVVFEASPFGKKESFFEKAKKTLAIFGPVFFIKYSLQFICTKLLNKWNVKTVLHRHGVPIINIQGSINADESLETIRSYKPDLLISIAGNQIFKKPLIELAPKGCLNLHTALLPKYRGLMPAFWVLKNDEKETGASVFFVDEKIDHGPILVQKKVQIKTNCLETLIKETKLLGMDAIIEAIEKIRTGTYGLINNDDSLQTYYAFPTKNDVAEFLARGKRFF